MHEAIGHFVLHDQVPHVVLTRLPASLMPLFSASTETLVAPLDEDKLESVPVQAPRAGQWGVWPVASAEGDSLLEGALVTLQTLQENGRRFARDMVAASSLRPLAQCTHLVRLTPDGKVLGWTFRPVVT